MTLYRQKIMIYNEKKSNDINYIYISDNTLC